MNHLLPLLILSAGPSFDSPDASSRRAAAEAWSRRNGVTLSARALEARQERGAPCVRLQAPARSGCAQALELCTWGTTQGSCSGGWASSLGLELPDGGAAITLIDRAGWDVFGDECQERFPTSVHLVDGGRLMSSRRGRQLDLERCLREARANAKRQETNVQCDVLAVNPCRREAYLACSGRVRGDRVKRTTWVSWADGGAVDWEHPLGLTDDEAARGEDGGE